MKIISKYKDYYDYYQGIFGIDESKVYDRRSAVRMIVPRDGEVQALHVCIGGREYTFYHYANKFYYTPEEVMKMRSILNEENVKYNKYVIWYRKRTLYNETLEDLKKIWKPYEDTDKNKITREPVIAYWSGYGSWKTRWFVPILGDLPVTKVLDPKEVYILVEGFLGWLVDNPPLPDTQTNENKIVQHGFDTKQSFRHRK